ncbi:MAG: hypothetical protein JJ847_00360 [Prochlorococcus marinus CUG1438]|nr:hypothetical protein [Prochlorococcus marinus CUG1438]
MPICGKARGINSKVVFQQIASGAIVIKLSIKVSVEQEIGRKVRRDKNYLIRPTRVYLIKF